MSAVKQNMPSSPPAAVMNPSGSLLGSSPVLRAQYPSSLTGGASSSRPPLPSHPATPQTNLHPAASISNGARYGSLGSSPIATLSLIGSSPPILLLGGSIGAAAGGAGGSLRHASPSTSAHPTSGGGGSSQQPAPPTLYAAAKKFWKRLCFDSTLDPGEFTVGFVESSEQPVRQSGAGAWSLRVHDHLVELPHAEFVRRYSDDEIPFHRIAYFKHKKAVVWESEYHRARKPENGLANVDPTGSLGSTSSSITRAAASAAARPPSWSSVNFPPNFLRGSSPPQGRISRHSSHVHGSSLGGGSFTVVAGASDDEGEREDSSSREEDDDEEGDDWDDDEEELVAGKMEGEFGLPGLPEEGPDEDPGGANEMEGRGKSHSWRTKRRQQQRRQQDGLPGEKDAATQLHETSSPETEAAVAEALCRELPEQCWRQILEVLVVRGLCMTSRVNRWLRELSACPELWHLKYEEIFGEAPLPAYNPATVRRLCRRSELRAARWLEASAQELHVGYPDTLCLQLDDSKVVSGDGTAIRVWSHVTGRRIATLKGHTGRVHAVAYDEELVVSGCSQGAVRVWNIDDLKCTRHIRTAHEGAVTGVALINGIPVSSGSDGFVRLWDVAVGLPILSMEAPRPGPILGLHVQQQSGYIVTCGDGVQMYDASSAQMLHDLRLPEGFLRSLGSARGGRPASVVQPPPPPTPPGPQGGAESDEEEGSEAEDEEGEGGQAAVVPPPTAADRFTCVAYSGNVLAAGIRDHVILWDPRCPAPIGVIGGRQGGGGGGERGGSCVALQLDDWKLLAAFNYGGQGGGAHGRRSSGDGRGGRGGSPKAVSGTGSVVALYDMRAAPARGARGGAAGGVQSGRDKRPPSPVAATAAASSSPSSSTSSNLSWAGPLMQLRCPGRVTALQFHKESVLVGLSGQDCVLWNMKPPSSSPLDERGSAGGMVGVAGGGGCPTLAAAAAVAASAGESGSWAVGAEGASPGQEGEGLMGGGGGGGRGRKASKPAKVPVKKNNRFPKRSR